VVAKVVAVRAVVVRVIITRVGSVSPNPPVHPLGQTLPPVPQLPREILTISTMISPFKKYLRV
jgi:hypothetical protein